MPPRRFCAEAIVGAEAIDGAEAIGGAETIGELDLIFMSRSHLIGTLTRPHLSLCDDLSESVPLVRCRMKVAFFG